MADHGDLRASLERKLETLTARLSKIEGHLHDPGDRDSEEQSLQRQNDEVLEHLDETEQREVEQIRDALARMDEGTYGQCETCGGAISSARLEALPYTSLCIDCAQ
jgi:RNA polymerase-binding protein DksA